MEAVKINVNKYAQKLVVTKAPATKASGITTDIVAVIWSIGTLIFFNFFRDYIAYY